MSEQFEVYDFTSGKVGWLASGMPREGTNAQALYAGDVVDRRPPTCTSAATVADVRAQLEGGRYGFSLVVNRHGIVLGRVRRSALTASPGTAQVEDVMEGGPSTVRANELVAELVERLAKRNLKTAIVTTPAGCLFGVFDRAEGEARLAESPAAK